MNALTPDEFAAHVLSRSNPPQPFRPVADYDAYGDCIEFIASPDRYYAQRIDDLVTVYRSRETGQVIGSLIKGVSRLCRELTAKLPGFKIEVREGRVRLEHLFLARLWMAAEPPSEMVVVTYRKLAEVADDADAEVQMGSPA